MPKDKKTKPTTKPTGEMFEKFARSGRTKKNLLMDAVKKAPPPPPPKKKK